jgi:hypothetical protein
MLNLDEEILVQTATTRTGDIVLRVEGPRGGLVGFIYLTERQARELVHNLVAKLTESE